MLLWAMACSRALNRIEEGVFFLYRAFPRLKRKWLIPRQPPHWLHFLQTFVNNFGRRLRVTGVESKPIRILYTEWELGSRVFA